MKDLPLLIFACFFFVCIYISAFAGNFVFRQQEKEKRFQIVNLRDTGIMNSTLTIDSHPILISSQFSFTEGPATDAVGNIYFSDQPNDQIWKYDVEGKLSLFMEKTGRSNGMYFDNEGNLISCADEHNELWAITNEKKVSVLAADYKGGTFNGPNDVWVNPKSGGMYFTDPYYKRDYWPKDHGHMTEERVYFLAKGDKNPVIADGELQKPNGIVGTPDGRFLYVADIGADKTFRYRIEKDGRLTDKQLFVNQGSDGMTIDEKGNVYLTGKGVTIYNSSGDLIQKIPIDEQWTGNVTFGGKEKNILFITASKSVYIIHMKVKGVQ